MCTEIKLVGRSKKLIEMKKNLKLTLLQKKILPGILLGNAHLETQNNGKTYRLHVYQSEKHKEYVYHLYEIFKPWCLSKPKIIQRKNDTGVYKNKKSTMISFKTISSGSFRFYAHIFLHPSGGAHINKNSSFLNAASPSPFAKQSNGEFVPALCSCECKRKNLTKKVPKLIHRWLNPISLAYWYMDDGGIKDKKSKSVYFHTQGFSFHEVKLLCKILNWKFNLIAKPVKKKKKYQIYISSKSCTTLKNLIYPYLLKEMVYKFPDA